MQWLLIGLAVFVIVVWAWISASIRRYRSRPGQDEYIQMRYADRQRLEHESINGGFWRFIAKLEFFLLLGAAIWILILTNMH